MTLASVNPGDIVRVDKKGRQFLAFVVEKKAQELSIEPISDHYKYFSASAREIIDIWSKRKKK